MERPENKIEMAIILAPDDTGARKLLGLPAARRLVFLLRRLGIGEIHLIGRVQKMEPLLRDLLPPENFHAADDLLSLRNSAENLGGTDHKRILLLKANHVIDRFSLGRLEEAGAAEPGISFMNVRGANGSERIYCGTLSLLLPFLSRAWSAADPPLMGGAQEVKGSDGLPRVLDGGTETVRAAESGVLKSLRLQTWYSDGFLARHVSRWVSQWLTRRLVRTPITPNQVTITGVSIGLAGAFLLSWPGYWPKAAGSLLFLFCIIVDGVDGEIARLKFQESAFGHYLDVISDNLVHAAVFLGIALGLYRDSGNPWFLYLFLVLLGGFGFSAAAVHHCLSGKTAVEMRNSPRTLRLLAFMSNRDFAYLVAVLAFLHRLEWFLAGAAVGSYLFALLLWVVSAHERKWIAAKTAPLPDPLPLRRSDR